LLLSSSLARPQNNLSKDLKRGFGLFRTKTASCFQSARFSKGDRGMDEKIEKRGEERASASAAQGQFYM
jgi:hypothetical protein